MKKEPAKQTLIDPQPEERWVCRKKLDDLVVQWKRESVKLPFREGESVRACADELESTLIL